MPQSQNGSGAILPVHHSNDGVLGTVICAAAVLLGIPNPLSPARPVLADPDTVPTLTLRGWDRRVRTAVQDPTHSNGGRYSDRGPLRRWTPDMDHEYDLDLFVIRPTLADDAAFYATENGIRSSAGSITTGHFAIESEARVAPRVADLFQLVARIVQQEDLSARRAAVELGYFADLGKGQSVGVRHTFAEFKSDLDAEVVWRGYGRSGWEGEASFGLLDAANNLINDGLVPDPVHDDTLRVYRSPPLWLSGRASVPVGDVRVEALGGLAPHRVADVRLQSEPTDAFTLGEAWAHGGVLVEAVVARGDRRSLVVGGLARGTRSVFERENVADLPDTTRYSTRQVTWEVGAFALGRWRSLAGQAWLAREGVADRQAGVGFRGSAIGGPFDVAERWTWLRLRTDWAPGMRSGPTVGMELAADLRSFPNPDDQAELEREVMRFYPYGPNSRATVRLGWRFSPHADIVFGGSRDLDGDPFYTQPRGRYDGAYVRLRATW